jgi:signal transduction histidine kinase
MGDLAPRSRVLRIANTIGFVIAIGMLDFISGYRISFSIFYLLPIGYAMWSLGMGVAIPIACLSVGVWLLGDWMAGMEYPNPFVPIWNASITLGFYLVVIALLSWVKWFQRTLESRVEQRTRALAEEIEIRQELQKEILIISEREQQRIGHDLHDTLCQHLTATAIAGQILQEKLVAESRPEIADAGQIVDMVEEGIAIARSLARGLFPVEIEGQGLISALKELAATHDGRNGIACRFQGDPPAMVQDTFAAAHLYRIAQEAVRNAVKHSGAASIVIGLEQMPEAAVLTIRDNGKGIGTPSDISTGLGLHIMRHRAEIIGAVFNVRSGAEGTEISCELPLADSAKIGRGPT